MHNLRSEINQVALRTEGMSGQSRRYLMHATWVGRLGAQVTCAVQVRRWSGKRRTAVWIVTSAKDVAFCILSKPLPMLMLRRVSQRRQYLCRHGLRSQHTLARGERPTKKWDAESPDDGARVAEWEAHGRSIRSGAQQSMLSVLEERGFVKDVAG
jgi:hypothetical protein